MQFQLLKDQITNEVSTTQILMVDDNNVTWTVPLGTGHRFEEQYDDWLAAGNKPLPPA